MLLVDIISHFLQRSLLKGEVSSQQFWFSAITRLEILVLNKGLIRQLPTIYSFVALRIVTKRGYSINRARRKSRALV